VKRILVTGGQGLVGHALVMELLHREILVRVSSRQQFVSSDPRLEYVRSPELSADADWKVALDEVDGVVHCAARVHVMREGADAPLDAFRAVNTAGTLNFARQCASAGVKRFVFISSVKVNGEFTRPGGAFTEGDVTAPSDPYGMSKHEAELGLRCIAADTGMEIVIIRPPLIYGPGVKANFLALMRVVRRGVPLPLGAVRNLRSLLALDNLIDFILLCLSHPAAANETFFVSDGNDLSTPQLIQGLAQASGVSPRLLPVPIWMLRTIAGALGKGDALQRLCGNLQVDISKAQQLLGWRPPLSVDAGLRRAVEGIQ
jgi:nucleoside-diphosphate-sugar epimerase